ncbi:MAG: hypothetical protein LBV38_05100 [Alistipes sp.]|jgi:hypothetical protein|nr:hypothetical protein [Alistipes sp.]
MRKSIFILLLALVCATAVAQENSVTPTEKEVREYPFLLIDSPAKLSTMRQADENMLSLYRMAIRGVNSALPYRWSALIQAGVSGFVLIPFSHEEGHRSILTYNNIGSVSRPYFNKAGAAYVQGVTDATLVALRDNHLPQFLRMHTAGLESDYATLLRENSLMTFGGESLDVLWVEYMMRKVALVGYYAWGLFKADIGIKEEADELRRDIVGHDIYGAVRHMHRPTAEYQRYVNYGDLTGEERKFVRRVGWLSLLNLVDPSLFTKTGFSLKNGDRINFALGYSMAPFGDFIDQHFWWATRSFNTHFYVREYGNKTRWFPALGAEISDMKLGSRLAVAAAIHGWQQPEMLSFTSKEGRFGGAVELMGKFMLNRDISRFGISADLGITAKSEGFLLEYMAMERHLGVRFGTSLWF